jgi:hypothetical protein
LKRGRENSDLPDLAEEKENAAGDLEPRFLRRTL